VCSASISGENTRSGQFLLDNETFNIRAPHTDKALIRGTQSFETLQLYINNWACKQMGENVRQRNTLTDDQKQTAACNFVWRRDQEIQNDANFSVPAANHIWGTFNYKPPGKNLTTFVFKGAPKQQCHNDYECREVNTPGEVYTSCDFCEDYFNTYCDVSAFEVFKFCMEKVHCVCNSVLFPCATPDKKRCPQKEGQCGLMQGFLQACGSLTDMTCTVYCGAKDDGAFAANSLTLPCFCLAWQRNLFAIPRFPTACTFRCTGPRPHRQSP
jgi:hypothetical protein